MMRMSGCLTQSDVQEIGESCFEEFDVCVAELSPDLCAPFNQEARQLEAQLATMYKMVAKMARTEEDLECVAGMWGMMAHFCDEALTRIGKLSDQLPNCDASQFLDRISDTRKKCLRLQTMHL
jgi:hypothetical protein